MASPQMKERLSGVVLNTVSKGASPESKCPICLDHFKNISYLDVCLHKFCFCCIHEWLYTPHQLLQKCTGSLSFSIA
uniref:RING-type E3 ubiquitin transferase n=1 Tax=Cyprinus carpio TaxID=7962 RepID=A0A8C2IZQ5_CYPCA